MILTVLYVRNQTYGFQTLTEIIDDLDCDSCRSESMKDAVNCKDYRATEASFIEKTFLEWIALFRITIGPATVMGRLRD